MSITNTGKNGFNDAATVTDQFNISDYTKGLADFIDDCATPMTISIQGEWGSGKSSFMKMIENQLPKDHIKCIEFNTWEYSQFNMGDQLPISFMRCLIEKFDIPNDDQKEINKIVKGLQVAWHVGKEVGISVVDALIGGYTAEKVKNGINHAESALHPDAEDVMPDPISAIKELRDAFRKCVSDLKERQNISRVVIFIDDLDRLEPKKAVELLEVLKNFFDCEDCVFVLAIDYDVVCKGVVDKYGRLNEDDKENKRKGRSFFDKIIQVPFKMPIARYDITNYVENCFEGIGISGLNEQELKTYVKLITTSIGKNPRSMKRLFNSFLLLTKVTTDINLNEGRNKQLLFAILCLQNANDVSEIIYNYIVSNRDKVGNRAENDDMDKFQLEDFIALISGDYERIQENPRLNRDIDFDEDEIEEYNSTSEFWQNLRDTIEANGTAGIQQDEFENFMKVINLSSATSATDNSNSSQKRRKRGEECDIDVLLSSGMYDNALVTSFYETVETVVKQSGGIGPVCQDSGNINLYTMKPGRKKSVLTGRLGRNTIQVQLYPKDVEIIQNMPELHNKTDYNGYLNEKYTPDRKEDFIKLITACLKSYE